MFDWFTRRAPPEPPCVDLVWVDEAARLRAVVAESKTAGPPMLWCCFFEASLQRLSLALRDAGVSVLEVGAERIRWHDEPIVLVRADRLRNLGDPLPTELRLRVFERHPHPDVDRMLMESLSQRTRAVPTAYAALDEPLMLRFGGARTAELMRSLGLSADEPVEHPLVSRAMRDLRVKVASKVKTSREARSMDEWVREHLP